MAQDYEEIVRQWYIRLRPEFLRRLTAKYSGLSLYDAENLYQDTFIAVQENLMLGRVKEETSWSSYIMTIGMNMASKAWRKLGKTDSTDEGFDCEDDDSGSKVARRVEELLKTLPEDEGDTSLYKDPEAQSLLGNELIHTWNLVAQLSDSSTTKNCQWKRLQKKLVIKTQLLQKPKRASV